MRGKSHHYVCLMRLVPLKCRSSSICFWSSKGWFRFTRLDRFNPIKHKGGGGRKKIQQGKGKYASCVLSNPLPSFSIGKHCEHRCLIFVTTTGIVPTCSRFLFKLQMYVAILAITSSNDCFYSAQIQMCISLSQVKPLD